MSEISKVEEINEKSFEEVVKEEFLRLGDYYLEELHSRIPNPEYRLYPVHFDSYSKKALTNAVNLFATEVFEYPHVCWFSFLNIEDRMTVSHDSIREDGLRKKDEKSMPLIAALLENAGASHIPDELAKKLIDIGSALEGGKNYGRMEAVISKEQAKEFKDAFYDESIPERNYVPDLRYYILTNQKFVDLSETLIPDFFDDRSVAIEFTNELARYIIKQIAENEQIKEKKLELLEPFVIEAALEMRNYGLILHIIEFLQSKHKKVRKFLNENCKLDDAICLLRKMHEVMLCK